MDSLATRRPATPDPGFDFSSPLVTLSTGRVGNLRTFVKEELRGESGAFHRDHVPKSIFGRFALPLERNRMKSAEVCDLLGASRVRRAATLPLHMYGITLVLIARNV